MRQVNKELSLEERSSRNKFLDRINPTAKTSVESIIQVVDAIANDYFQDIDSDTELQTQSEGGYKGEPDQNYWAFRRLNFDGGKDLIGCAFFSVYVIGGQISKKGERPDIDLMVVTNMWWSEGYTADENEWFYKGLHKTLENNYQISCKDDLPNHYNEGLNKNKALIRLTPKGDGFTPIDIVYIRSLPEGNEEDKFISPEEFEQKDVDKNDNPLPRLLLYRASTTDITPPDLCMKW